MNRYIHKYLSSHSDEFLNRMNQMCLCIHAYAWWLFQMYVWIRVDPIYEFKHACISEWDKFQAWTIHLVNAPWYWITRLLYRKMPNIFFNGKNRKKYIVCNSRKKKKQVQSLATQSPLEHPYTVARISIPTTKTKNDNRKNVKR